MLALLGFDAASPVLLEKLLEEGKLPALAKLRSRGRKIALVTPATHLAAATYRTLWSGADRGGLAGESLLEGSG